MGFFLNQLSLFSNTDSVLAGLVYLALRLRKAQAWKGNRLTFNF